MVVSAVDRVHVGDTFKAIPPHLTVFPWFDIPTENFALFDQDMQEIIDWNPRMEPEGGSTVLFGDDESIPARRFDRATAGFNVIQHFDIHASVFRSVNELGGTGTYDPQYVGLDYHPHMTDSADRAVQQGEVVSFDNLTVIKKDEARRLKLVKAVYLWDKIDG